MLEWEIFTKSQIPGPKYYPKMSWDRGGTFSNAHPMSALEWEIYRARGVSTGNNQPTHPCPIQRVNLYGLGAQCSRRV